MNAQHFALAAAIIMIQRRDDCAYACNCKGMKKCEPTTNCQKGCKLGFSGPACQVTDNVAYGKWAYQSNVHEEWFFHRNARLAVDGIYTTDPLISWAPNCSHTKDTPEKNWWEVVISRTIDYVITNITIVNRPDSPANSRLRNFRIYISRSYSMFPYGNWTFCAEQPDEAPLFSSYTCNETNIGKTIAIELQRSRGYLTLCEVIIAAYEYKECPKGFSGPQCLLKSCDDDTCAVNNGTCGPLGGCRFTNCPGGIHLPPDCRMSITNFAKYTWSISSTEDSIMIVGHPKTTANLSANSIGLDVRVYGRKINYKGRTKASYSANRAVELTMAAERGISYEISLLPRMCFKERFCYSGDQECYNKGDCFDGPSSEWLKIDRELEGPVEPEYSDKTPGLGTPFVLLIVASSIMFLNEKFYWTILSEKDVNLL